VRDPLDDWNANRRGAIRARCVRNDRVQSERNSLLLRTAGRNHADLRSGPETGPACRVSRAESRSRECHPPLIRSTDESTAA
jgi:hypothetical protein